MLYEDKANVMDLYNAINDEKCTDPEEIEINTLSAEDGVDGGFFARFSNDLSFVIGSFLHLYEHQSTFNENMPLRMLIYGAKLILKSIPTKFLYKDKAVKIPSPRFIVFYNGAKEAKTEFEMKLSEQYAVSEKNPALELRIMVYNINTDKGCRILEQSRTLREYSIFVERTRDALKDLKEDADKRAAMEQVVEDCIRDGILSAFLEERKGEVIMTSIFNYDQAAHEWALHDDGFEEGREFEQKNTEAERKRADAAESRADAMAAELAKYKERFGTI